ncbi:hypothetical protein D9615_009103 [Tricholomella constricta]|uniref:F-box domain-containing protein n=1 Tax=Tricholomella constricta TaxID=117010 RepID=A0A8H5GZZ0_9AGAR|nr:hypothetical protein D9615_009103 [Tricholomella constricta]
MAIALHSPSIRAPIHVLDDVSGLTSVPRGAARTALLRWAQHDFYHSLRLINQATPIGSLPAEILGKIFEVANRSKTTEDHYPWSNPYQWKPLPVAVSQVSSYWRDVALDSPLLWTEIDISPPWSLKTICLFLRRSKACPIHLNLTIPTIAFGNLLTPAVVNASAHILCDHIAQHIPRCRKISIKGDFHQLEPLLDAIINTILPSGASQLERLVMHITSVPDFQSDVHPTLFSQGFPVLTHVQVTSLMVPFLPSLPQVTSLQLALGDTHGIDLATFLALAASCPSLETLTIFDDVICGPWPLTATIDFPFLRSLQIYGTFTSVSDLLRVVSAPLLEDLVIAPVVADDLLAYHQHASTSAPKFSNLRSITLSPVSTSGFALLLLASECFPDVERLTIPNIHANSFCDILTGIHADIVWPNLKALALRNVDADAMQKLLTVMSFRKAAGWPLQTLYLDAASLHRIAFTVSSFPPQVEVVEYDVWSMLHDEDLLHEAAHYVGNDFDFIS